MRRRAGRGGVARLARDGIARRASRFGASPRRRVAPSRRRRAGPRGVGPADERRVRNPARAESDSRGCFRAVGGATLPTTRAAAGVRHRAALHARLARARLADDAPDQAGMCLRQLCAALGGDRLPRRLTTPRRGRPSVAPSRSPRTRGAPPRWRTPRDSPRRKVRRNSRETAKRRSPRWRTRRRDASANEPRRGTGRDARRVGERTESRNGTRRAARRERARAARSVRSWRRRRARRRRCGPRSSRRARDPRTSTRAQAHFARPELVDDPTADDWPARLFAQRALADVFFHRGASDVGRERASDLAPAMALWATSAGADAVSGGVGPLAAALFSRPSLRVLGEGAAAGAGAESVARLQSRCAERGDDATSTIAFAPAGSNASRDAARRRRAGRGVDARRGGISSERGGARRRAARLRGRGRRGRVSARRRRVSASRARVRRLPSRRRRGGDDDRRGVDDDRRRGIRACDGRARRRRRGNRALARRVHREGADAPPGGDRTGRARRARAPRARARVRVGCATRRERTWFRT